MGSTRTGGNTEQLARRAAAGLPEAVGQQWVRLIDLSLPGFRDLRHSGDGTYPSPGGDARRLLDATLRATDIVIASPLYWYSLSAPVKNYLDHWAGWLRVPGLEFRARMAGKTLWGVTALADQDRSVADPLVGTLRHTARYMDMRLGGVLLGNGNAPGQVLADGDALEETDTFLSDASLTAVAP
ncbi:NAD(P)H-dependent oxidoreductase [Streptomyces sp. TRM76323]|uniref:NAD(P)H-dependent oxidoreductase n=1 Tax=Streptomyces tamarix TaxID=3078565 RepID=A0ABU3QFT1_9ACTN|nr:NAD(P)H-dependent oxidoreductase [Streptomyces tamarix]MDT9681625.1 NAD(P)H-dependent oxidoreductase [Streptomyces tamarix]